MELITAIKTRRSIRNYKPDPMPEDVVKELLGMAIWAPSGMNSQPWSFVVIENQEYLKSLSDRCKDFLLSSLDRMPILERYRSYFSDPETSIFYHAPVLVLIYGDKNLFTSTTDCSMAALNLMLSAWDRGIGSCWIGFSYGICNSPEFKEEFHLPENHQLVAPIILGYPQEPIPQGDRKEVPLLYWMK